MAQKFVDGAMNADFMFPVGRLFDASIATQDPYPLLARMREEEPVSWVPTLGMYYITRHEDIATVLKDDARYLVGGEQMLVFDTFGKHMMTTDGVEQRRYRMATRASFTPKLIRERLEQRVVEIVSSLVRDIAPQEKAELRAAFASRLPVQVMLAVFGLPPEDEPLLRTWFDSFEKALANYTWDEAVRSQARVQVSEFKQHLARRLTEGAGGLLSELAGAKGEDALTEEEIYQNALIIFFGGISTVEALILNTLFALSSHAECFQRVRSDRGLIPKAIEETARWLSPVQSATRLVATDTEIRGVSLARGDLVNCMLGSANRDARVFERPDEFDLDRTDLGQHLAFATGPHHCLGSHLARAEARIALEALLALPGFDVSAVAEPRGYEFRQPGELFAVWRA